MGVVFVTSERIVTKMDGHADRIELACRGVHRLDRGVRRRQQIVPLLCVVKGKVEERIDGCASQGIDEALLREAPHVRLQEAALYRAREADCALLRGGVMKEQ